MFLYVAKSDPNITDKIFDSLRSGFDPDKTGHNIENLLRIRSIQILDSYILADEKRYSAYTVKANILLDMQQVEEAKAVIERSIDLGDERHSAYRQASNISHRLKVSDAAITYAEQAVDAKDNNDTTRANHKEHLANLLRITGQLDDALAAVVENE